MLVLQYSMYVYVPIPLVLHIIDVQIIAQNASTGSSKLINTLPQYGASASSG
jgi:hypothetical protein